MREPFTILLLYLLEFLSDLNANTYKHGVTVTKSLLYGAALYDKHQNNFFTFLIQKQFKNKYNTRLLLPDCY